MRGTQAKLLRRLGSDRIAKRFWKRLRGVERRRFREVAEREFELDRTNPPTFTGIWLQVTR